MKLSRGQNTLLQIYRRAARLDESDYRALMREASGCVSARSPYWSNAAFDDCMARLEAVLFDRVERGAAPDPAAAGNRHIRERYHWRAKRGGAPGILTTRQIWKIQQCWLELVPHLEPKARNLGYLAGIIKKATGRPDVGLTALTKSEADLVIDALSDRVTHTKEIPA